MIRYHLSLRIVPHVISFLGFFYPTLYVSIRVPTNSLLNRTPLYYSLTIYTIPNVNILYLNETILSIYIPALYLNSKALTLRAYYLFTYDIVPR